MEIPAESKVAKAGEECKEVDRELSSLVTRLLTMLFEKVPREHWRKLPDNCRLYPFGHFDATGENVAACTLLNNEGSFTLHQEGNISFGINEFAKLIQTGWLERLAAMLQDISKTGKESVLILESFLESNAA